MGVTVHFEGDVQACLIASFGDVDEPETFDVEVAATEAPSMDEGCGCPDVAAKLADYKPLLLPDELKSRQAKVAEYERI